MYLVNQNQSPQERALKYNIIRKHGLTRSRAIQIRDWRWSKIRRFFGYASFKDMLLAMEITINDCTLASISNRKMRDY